MIDAQTRFSNAQSVAAVVSTLVSTNVLDLGLTGAVGTDDMGTSILSDPGRADLKVLCVVTTAVTSGTSVAYVKAQLVSSASADLSNPTVLCQTDAILVTSLVAGYQFRFGTIPPGVAQRYLGMNYVITGETTTAGAVTAAIVDAKSTNVAL